MHRSDALEWQVVVHHREHTLLHFTTVPSVDDYLFAACYVECNASFWVQTEFLVVFYLSLRSVVDNEVWLEVSEFFFGRTDKHVGHEVSLPCYFYDEANSHTSVGVSTAECVNYKKLLIWKFLLCDFLNVCPSFFCHWVVIVLVTLSCPPYGVLWGFIHNDILVFRRTTGVDTCHYVYGAKFCVLTYFIAFEACLCFFFEEYFVRRIVHYLSGAWDAVLQ